MPKTSAVMIVTRRRERQHAPVERHVERDDRAERGQLGDQQARTPPGEEQANHGARGGEQQTLG